MVSFRRRLLVSLIKLSDVSILTVCVLIAASYSAFYTERITLLEFLALRVRVVNFILFLGMALAWHLLFHHFRLYSSRRLGAGSPEWKDILKATTAGSLLFLLAGLGLRLDALKPSSVLIFWLASSILTISFRVLLRQALKLIRLRGRNLRLVLIVGTNQRAYEFADMIAEKKELGFRLIGFIDESVHMPRPGVRLIGGLADFPGIVMDRVVDEVFIALPIKSFYKEIEGIVAKAEEQGIAVRFLWQFFDTTISHPWSEDIEDLSTLMMTSGPQEGWSYLAKQIMDRVLAVLMLALTSPIMLVAAIGIRISSPGPLLFRQKRVGKNKRVFILYKFRTMVAGAEQIQSELESQNEVDGPVFKIKNDPRVTRVGRWLRTWCIDELPQFYNVLKGEMSLVGPRPLPLRDYSGFDQDWQRRRFSVLPGITCTWQVGGRNEIPFEDWMRMDMEYIDNWSLLDDLRILVRTIPTVLKARGV